MLCSELIISFAGLLGLIVAAPGMAGQPEFNWDYTLSAQRGQSGASLYLPGSRSQSSESINGILDLEIVSQSWASLLALKADNLYHSDSGGYHSRLILRELFTQGEIELGDQLLEYQLGKMRLDWGVGYGYRPLDLFKPYQRNPVGVRAEEGSGVASLSRFDLEGEWTLLYSDSSWNQQSGNALAQRNEQQGVGVRRYILNGDSEYQWIAYYDDVRHGTLAASYITVLDSAWELHGSVRVQHKHQAYALPATTNQPAYITTGTQAWLALAGFTWASESGHQLIGEYWYDSRAWSKSDWKIAHQRAAMLAGQPALAGLRASYANGFRHANLVRHNLMLHWQLDGRARFASSDGPHWLSDVTPTLDLLIAPEDGGLIATQWLSYKLHDTGDSSSELEFAARFYTGSSNSVFASLPNQHMLLLNLKGRF